MLATAQALLEKFDNFKTLPKVAIRLTKLIADENCTVQELEKMIRIDPGLVGRLLNLVNSSYYGLSQKVDSVAGAVVFLGIKNLRNLVIVEALKDMYKNSSGNDIFSKNQLWLHCAAASICSQMISERIFEQKGEDAFLCGIIHDIGMIVEDQVASDLFFQACKSYNPKSRPFTIHEREIIGTDHCLIGYLLAGDWKLPAEVQEAIKVHHKSLKDVSPSSIAGIIQLAEYIITRLNYNALPGMMGMLSPPLEAHVRDNLAEYQALAKDFPNEMFEAKELYETPEK